MVGSTSPISNQAVMDIRTLAATADAQQSSGGVAANSASTISSAAPAQSSGSCGSIGAFFSAIFKPFTDFCKWIGSLLGYGKVAPAPAPEPEPAPGVLSLYDFRELVKPTPVNAEEAKSAFFNNISAETRGAVLNQLWKDVTNSNPDAGANWGVDYVKQQGINDAVIRALDTVAYNSLSDDDKNAVKLQLWKNVTNSDNNAGANWADNYIQQHGINAPVVKAMNDVRDAKNAAPAA